MATASFIEAPAAPFEPSPLVPRVVFNGPAPALPPPRPSPSESQSPAPKPPSPSKSAHWSIEETSRLLQCTSFVEAFRWEDVYPQLETSRPLSSIKAQFKVYKARYYYPEGPLVSPDLTPWKAEHAELVGLLKMERRQEWVEIQRLLGSGRSIEEIQRRAGARKRRCSTSKAPAVKADTKATDRRSNQSSPPAPSADCDAAIAPAALNSIFAVPCPVAASGPARRIPVTTQHVATSQRPGPSTSSSSAAYDVLSTIADILFPSTPAPPKGVVHATPSICRCCSKPINTKGAKRTHGEEGSKEGETVKRRRVDQAELGVQEAVDEGEGYAGWA
ncbi:hypothetical protein BCR35DRAFT_333655 [Leucosporidium creatinivorum]|uniref:Uncharacterized protein n=1 Tax=Leucosporidium creatinivorum TaxID=106004 RepID=A0A1Y2EQ48_9BASI|nr:hypothetical protein BCR35DRAFT_333655 [Leucosporidium creatinivorum]